MSSDPHSERRLRIRTLATDIQKHAESLVIALTTDSIVDQVAHAECIELAAVELMDHIEEIQRS